MSVERRGAQEQLTEVINLSDEKESSLKAKPFAITQEMVKEAYRKVKKNGGCAGVDGESLKEFESRLEDNLYKLWNRLSSGSYFPPPVKAVVIAKAGGGKRTLGVPTVADRVAQTVVKMALEPMVEPHFDRDSYGSRPKKSAHEALASTRERCWRKDWVIDLDIQGFFDALNHELVLKAVAHHTDCPWILLYVRRWVTALLQWRDGSVEERTQGTPQGGVISPLLANLFMHYAFDAWMRRTHPGTDFERYVDDVIVHASSLGEAEKLLESIRQRLRECHLELHPVKTKIVYCRDERRPGRHEHEQFDFLSYTFRPRQAKTRWGKLFVGFSPAISGRSAQEIREEVRSWRLIRQHNTSSLEGLSQWMSLKVRGWVQYFGRFNRGELQPLHHYLKHVLCQWARRKFKHLRGKPVRSFQWFDRLEQLPQYAWLRWSN
jgi:group II intron reverse transcriptase/maturase